MSRSRRWPEDEMQDVQVIFASLLSCRLQFNQLLPYPVIHPVELLGEAYDAFL